MAKAGGGAIVNLSSGGATRAHRGLVAYDASKGGIEALTRAAAIDLAPYGIRVNTLVPGLIATSQTSRTRRYGVATPPSRSVEAAPGDVAGPALFLVSDDAAYITGVRLVVDDGILVQQRSPRSTPCCPLNSRRSRTSDISSFKVDPAQRRGQPGPGVRRRARSSTTAVVSGSAGR